MKKLILILTAAAFLSGCTGSTPHGPCVGAFEDRNPKKVYKLSIWNTFLGIVFIETLIVPIVVVSNQVICPIGDKDYNAPVP